MGGDEAAERALCKLRRRIDLIGLTPRHHGTLGIRSCIGCHTLDDLLDVAILLLLRSDPKCLLDLLKRSGMLTGTCQEHGELIAKLVTLRQQRSCLLQLFDSLILETEVEVAKAERVLARAISWVYLQLPSHTLDDLPHLGFINP
jgi:hypothetical protein